MPSLIQIQAPVHSATTFRIRLQDWNGDELPISQSRISLNNNRAELQLIASSASIGEASVGLIQGRLLMLQGRASYEVRLDGVVIATIEARPGATTLITSNGVVAGSEILVPVGIEPPTGFVRVSNRQKVTPITLFQSGHGWALYTTSGASPFSNLNETAGTQKYGSQHAWAGTAGGASAGFAGIQRIGATAIDTTGKTLRVTFKIVNKANLQEFGIFIGTGSLANYCRIYAHSNQAQWQYREGEIVTIDYPLGTRTFAAAADYAVTGSPVMNAITDMRFRVQDGAAGPNMGSVELHLYEVSLVSNRSTGKICFVFDDDDASVYSIAYPILKAAGIPGSTYIIANTVGTSGKMTVAQLDELHIDGWSHCAHSYADTMHDARIVTQSAAAVEADMQACKDWLNARGYNGANHYAYPGGDFDTGSVSRLNAARRLFRSARGINTRQAETFPVSLPHRLRTIYATSTTTAQVIKDRLDCAMNDTKGLAIITFHRLVPGTPSINTEYQTSNFQDIVNYVVSQSYVQYCTTMNGLELDGLL